MEKTDGFFKERYDTIIIGGALSGLASALMLADKGKDVLVLEQHNLPGGLATSFVRGGVELEATLHEMMSIGPEEQPLKIRKFFDEIGVKIDWIPVPEAYRVILPNSDIDVTLHPGYERMAHEVDSAVPGTYEKVLHLMQLCNTVYESVNVLSVHPMSKVHMLIKHDQFVKTAGYSAMDVIDTFDLPREAVEILSAYWIYVGNPMTTLPFTVYAVLMADYFRGSYVCNNLSHGMSLAMERRAVELGAQVEYRQHVEKILVKNGRVTGVRTSRGDVIKSDYVISGAYPNTVYSKMIEPLSEVPACAIRSINARRMSVTCFSVIMLLDQTPEQLGIDSYSVFSGDTLDTEKIYEQCKTLGPYDYLTTICLNHANPDCVPKGMTELSITTLPLPEGWFKITEDDYHKTERRIARQMIEKIEKLHGINLLDHITEIVIESPMTIAHYTGAWNGGIYGYRHCQDDNIVARLTMSDEERYITGLEFAGAHAISGNGMSPCITNGRKAAKGVLDEMEKEARA
ncbi:MAG: NAD(P)/FAD-dependent oxidoreductase [Oscillospiraceae bacterium]